MRSRLADTLRKHQMVLPYLTLIEELDFACQSFASEAGAHHSSTVEPNIH